MRVLVVEDNRRMGAYLLQGLREHGYAVDLVADHDQALAQAASGVYDLLILDRMLPGGDGLDVLRQLREQGLKTQAIFLTAKASIDDRVEGLNGGADDYLVKPFSFVELLARVRAVARRGTEAATTVIEVHDLKLDESTRLVERAGKRIELSSKQFALLRYLMLHADEVVSRTMLLEHVWNFDFDGLTNVVDVHINRLRNKVDRGFERPLIHTLRGVGYVLRAGAQRRRLGLRTRVALWIMGVMSIALVASLLWARHNVRRVLEAENDSFLLRKIAELEAIALEGPSGRASLDDEIRREVWANEEEGLIVIVGHGEALQIVPEDVISRERAQAQVSAMSSAGAGDGPSTAVLAEGRAPYRVLRRDVGNSRIAVGLSLAKTERTLAQFNGKMTAGVLLFVVAAALGGMLLSRQALRPVAESIERARQLNPAELSARLPLTGANDELDRLAAAFNALLDRLAENHAQVIRFTADASHELRSPLAVMRAAIEVALQEDRPAEAYRDTLDALAEQCQRLTTLVNSLLLLAGADTGQLTLRQCRLDLSALALETVEMYEPLADEAGIRLSAVVPRPVVVSGDRDRLRQVIGNLIDNAIKFTRRDGQISVAVSSHERAVRLVVSDSGQGIPADQLPHIFDRFYQVDAARSSEGFGLGLSICQSIVQAHGGHLRVASTSPCGTVMEVTLPIDSRIPIVVAEPA